jgi:hypothetical protein
MGDVGKSTGISGLSIFIKGTLAHDLLALSLGISSTWESNFEAKIINFFFHICKDFRKSICMTECRRQFDEQFLLLSTVLGLHIFVAYVSENK